MCKANHEQYLLFPTALTCGHPPAVPVHGQRNITGLTFGSTVFYSCKAGYTLTGSSIITCMANRQWSSNTADCSRKLLFHKMYMCICYLGVSMAAHQHLFCCFHRRSFWWFVLRLNILESAVACLPSSTDSIYISSAVHTDTSVNNYKLTQRENLLTKAKEVLTWKIYEILLFLLFLLHNQLKDLHWNAEINGQYNTRHTHSA